MRTGEARGRTEWRLLGPKFSLRAAGDVAPSLCLDYLDSGGSVMNVQIPLETMTVQEKLQAMEDIWADLRRQPDDIPSPDWHRDVLNAREGKRKDGSSVYEDWTVAKERIRKKI